MTATVEPPLADEPRRPENRVNGDAAALGDRFLPGSQRTYHPPVPAAEQAPDDAQPDVTSRELQALRREMALLRSDYAQLRGLLSTMRAAAGRGGPETRPRPRRRSACSSRRTAHGGDGVLEPTPPAEAIGVLEPTPPTEAIVVTKQAPTGAEAPRRPPRPTPTRRTEQGPAARPGSPPPSPVADRSPSRGRPRRRRSRPSPLVGRSPRAPRRRRAAGRPPRPPPIARPSTSRPPRRGSSCPAPSRRNRRADGSPATARPRCLLRRKTTRPRSPVTPSPTARPPAPPLTGRPHAEPGHAARAKPTGPRRCQARPATAGAAATPSAAVTVPRSAGSPTPLRERRPAPRSSAVTTPHQDGASGATLGRHAGPTLERRARLPRRPRVRAAFVRRDQALPGRSARSGRDAATARQRRAGGPTGPRASAALVRRDHTAPRRRPAPRPAAAPTAQPGDVPGPRSNGAQHPARTERRGRRPGGASRAALGGRRSSFGRDAAAALERASGPRRRRVVVAPDNPVPVRWRCRCRVPTERLRLAAMARRRTAGGVPVHARSRMPFAALQRSGCTRRDGGPAARPEGAVLARWRRHCRARTERPGHAAMVRLRRARTTPVPSVASRLPLPARPPTERLHRAADGRARRAPDGPGPRSVETPLARLQRSARASPRRPGQRRSSFGPRRRCLAPS
jgi:hypothetical protein